MYLRRDDNNHFLVKRWAGDPRPRGEALVRHGDLVRLEHVNTRRNLHSHNRRALVAPNHYQVNTILTASRPVLPLIIRA